MLEETTSIIQDTLDMLGVSRNLIYELDIIDYCNKHAIDYEDSMVFLLSILLTGRYDPYLRIWSREKSIGVAKCDLVQKRSNHKDKTKDSVPDRLFIELFSNTSTQGGGIRNFISENKLTIEGIQPQLRRYPSSKRYKKFKRDCHIYYLHLQGNDIKTILNKMAKSDPNLELEYSEARRVIKRLDEDLQNSE